MNDPYRITESPDGAAGAPRSVLRPLLWLGLIVSFLVFVLTGPILRLMQLPENLMTYAAPFLAIMGGTLFLEAINISICGPKR